MAVSRLATMRRATSASWALKAGSAAIAREGERLGSGIEGCAAVLRHLRHHFGDHPKVRVGQLPRHRRL